MYHRTSYLFPDGHRESSHVKYPLDYWVYQPSTCSIALHQDFVSTEEIRLYPILLTSAKTASLFNVTIGF